MYRKKILFILHIPPPVHGSSVMGQYVKNSKTINTLFACRYINLGTSVTVDEIGKKPLKKVVRYFSILYLTLIQLIRFKPQLCYVAITSKGLAFYKDTLVVFLVKLFGVKLVYHFHNKGVSTRENNWFDNLIYRLVFKDADAILLSKYLYPDIQKYFPEKRVYYCPNGIPDRATKKKETKIEDNKPVEILFLSNLIASKGVFVLLEACRILKEKKIPFRCTYVGGEGDVTNEEFNNKVNNFNLNDQVDYLGKKYGDKKIKIFEKSDIFAFPTYYHNECFPLVLLEAMQHKLPVVSTFEGGIQDIVEDGRTGFLVPQKDAVALADKLELLINNPVLRQQMGKAGHEKYEQKFTLNKFEARLKSILMEITE